MIINGKETTIGARYFNSVSVMVLNGIKDGEVINEYLELDTKIIYTNSKNVEIDGMVKSYNSMLTTDNIIIEVPLNSNVKSVSDNFIGHTIFTEDSNLDIMYNALDIQEHASITNIDGFENIKDTDITLQSQMSINLTPQRGIIDGLSFSTNSNKNILIDTGGILPRIDIVALKKDQLNRTIEIVVIKGTPNSSPSIPTYEQTRFGKYELPIFRVYVDVNETILSRINIADMRNPTSKENTVTKNILNDILSGTIIAFAGNTSKLPSNALFCDGREISRTTYARLFNKISTTWGRGDSTTTFNIPDGRGGVLKGAGIGNKYTHNEDRGPVGSYQDTAIKNITGSFGSGLYGDNGNYITSDGVFTRWGGGHDYIRGSPWGNGGIRLNASRVVPVGDTNRDNNLAVNWIIFT